MLSELYTSLVTTICKIWGFQR